jgi:hypothetical protein
MQVKKNTILADRNSVGCKCKKRKYRPRTGFMGMTERDKTGRINSAPAFQKYHLEFNSHFHTGIILICIPSTTTLSSSS